MEGAQQQASVYLATGALQKAVFLVVSVNPPSILLAASADSGIHAGDRVKAPLTDSAKASAASNKALVAQEIHFPQVEDTTGQPPRRKAASRSSAPSASILFAPRIVRA